MYNELILIISACTTLKVGYTWMRAVRRVIVSKLLNTYFEYSMYIMCVLL